MSFMEVEIPLDPDATSELPTLTTSVSPDVSRASLVQVQVRDGRMDTSYPAPIQHYMSWLLAVARRCDAIPLVAGGILVVVAAGRAFVVTEPLKRLATLRATFFPIDVNHIAAAVTILSRPAGTVNCLVGHRRLVVQQAAPGYSDREKEKHKTVDERHVV